MKYFTREWYGLMQGSDYCVCMKPIEDKEYSDAEIAALYERKINAELKRAEREYNEPPCFIGIDFDDPDFDLADYKSVDFETGIMREYSSKQELIESFEQEKRAAQEQFDARPPFDREAERKEIQDRYDIIAEHVLLRFPEYIRDRIDPRLAAIDYLPRSVYDELKALSKSNKKKFEAINKAARKELAKQNIPDEISREFGYHDSDVLSVIQSDKNVVMTLRLECAMYEDETPFTRVTFVNAEILESDLPVPYERRPDDYCVWLYEELYGTDDGKIEAHILLDSVGKKYLTVRCDTIEFENNVAESALI